MKEFGIVLIVLLSYMFLVILYLVIKDHIWFRRLNRFRQQESLEKVKPNPNIRQKRFVTLAITFALVVSILPMLNTKQVNPPVYVNKQMVNLKTVESKEKLTSMLGNYYDTLQYKGGVWFGGVEDTAGVPEAESPNESAVDREFIDTNNQVEGVQEADIIKTDGSRIFYGPYGRNKVSVIDVFDDTYAALAKDITFEKFYLSTMFLTDEYVVMVGYEYEQLERKAYSEDGPYFDIWYPYVYSGAIYVYDKVTLEEVYVYKTEGNFVDYRVIQNKLYLIANVRINQEDPRPTAEVRYEGETRTEVVDYDQIYYFDENNVTGLTTITVLNLESFELDTKGFLGRTEQIHVSETSIYITSTYYDYSMFNREINTDMTGTINFDEIYKTGVTKFRILEDGSVAYVGSTKVLGFVGGQYWMDEYDSYFRLVTTAWNSKHRLYVLKENEVIDTLDTVSYLDQGIGKPNESIKSVRFDKTKAHIVTFLQTDPLYTIDLSNPNFPVITNEIQEPGFSTYLHPWGEDYLVGLGQMADLNGRVTGIKLSVYDTKTLVPLETFELPYESNGGFSYSYTEGLYNPKAILVDSDKHIFAFALSTYSYSYVNEIYDYSYESEYLIFTIDFSKEKVISDPIIVNHSKAEYYYNVDRGIYIEFNNGIKVDKIIYTFSEYQMISINYETGLVVQTLPLISEIIPVK